MKNVLLTTKTVMIGMNNQLKEDIGNGKERIHKPPWTIRQHESL